MRPQDVFLLILVGMAILVALVALLRMKPQARQDPECATGRRRLQVAGLGFTPVEPGAEREIVVCPQRVFRPKLLTVPPSIAEHFEITGVYVGSEPVIDASGPASDFCGMARDPELQWPECCPGQSISLHVANRSDRTQTFAGMLVGVGESTQEPDPERDLLSELSEPAERVMAGPPPNWDPYTPEDSAEAQRMLGLAPMDPGRRLALEGLRMREARRRGRRL